MVPRRVVAQPSATGRRGARVARNARARTCADACIVGVPPRCDARIDVGPRVALASADRAASLASQREDFACDRRRGVLEA